MSRPLDGTAFIDGAEKQRLPAAELKTFTTLHNGRAAIALLQTFGVIALLFLFAIMFPHPLVWLAIVLLMATRQQALFVLAHDAAHYRLFANRRANDAAGRLCGTVVGISMDSYRVVHRLHHNHLYQRQDPDLPIHAGYPRGKTYLVKKLIKDLSGLTAYKTYSYFFGAPVASPAGAQKNGEAGAPARPLDDTAPALRAAARRDRWRVVGFHIAAPVAAFAAGAGPAYLILWLLPLVTVLQALLRVRAICEHGAVSETTTPLRAARTNLGPAWLRWLFFPHNVNYHIEHHLYPSVPHYNLPGLHRALRQRGLLQNAEVRNVGDTLRRIFAEPAATA